MAVMFWFSHQRSAFFEASKDEQKDAIERLISQTSVRSGYYLLLVLASLIVTPGLFLQNVSVLIGGMILAPLLVPLLLLSLSLVTGNVRGVYQALGTILVSIIVAVGTAFVMSFALSRLLDDIPLNTQNIPPAVYILIAFCSGVAGAFAWVKEDLAPAIAGVATAVALLPPLCAAGIGLAIAKLDIVRENLLIFLSNFLGITLAAFLVFWVLGFLNTGTLQDRLLKKQENGEK